MKRFAVQIALALTLGTLVTRAGPKLLTTDPLEGQFVREVFRLEQFRRCLPFGADLEFGPYVLEPLGKGQI